MAGSPGEQNLQLARGNEGMLVLGFTGGFLTPTEVFTAAQVPWKGLGGA